MRTGENPPIPPPPKNKEDDGNDPRSLGGRRASPVIDGDTSLPGRGKLREIAQLPAGLRRALPLVCEAAVFAHLGKQVRRSRRPCFGIGGLNRFSLRLRPFSPELTFLPLAALPRFADSIRGMLKLILVLMLAGASLASTWFTLTCLSQFTHLPTTAGQYTTAHSLVRSH